MQPGIRWPFQRPVKPMTVREFFTELLAQIEDTNVLLFAAAIVGGWLLIRNIRKTRLRDAMLEWRQLNANERRAARADLMRIVAGQARCGGVCRRSVFWG